MSLENRYRLLLTLYPRAHRREYGEEMLSVLIAGSGPSRRLPALLDIVDIARSAAAMHWRLSPWRSEAWQRAALIVQVFGAILLLSVDLRRLALSLAAAIDYPPPGLPPLLVSPGELLRPALWAAVILAALLRVRTLAVAFALAGLAAEVAVPARYYFDTPARVLDVWWIILAATAVVIAAGLVTARRSSAVPPGTPWIIAAGATVVASASAELWPVAPIILAGSQVTTAFGALTLTLALVPAAIGVSRSQPEVRRRVLAAAGAVAVALPLVQVGFAGFIRHNQLQLRADLLNPAQWLLLVLIPAATFAGITAVIARRERGVSSPRGESLGVSARTGEAGSGQES